VREYMPGDDVRIIDWKVTSRMNAPYVKEFIEERDLTMYILFDVSGSNNFGSTKPKKEAAVDVAASLMFAALKNSDKVGLCLFTDTVELYRKARAGRRHVLQLIHELVYFKPQSKVTNINEALRFILKVVKKRSIIFIISDFYSPDFAKTLSILKTKHDVITINLNDVREEEIPDVGYLKLEDEETGEQILVNTSDEQFRQSYVQLVDQKNARLHMLFKKLSIDTIHIKSHEPFEVPLRKFFRLREKRMVR